MKDTDKLAILNNTASIPSTIEILPISEDEDVITLTENRGIVSWDYEDFRYVANEGFIGQFVARKVTGKLKIFQENLSLLDREIILSFCVKTGSESNWYSLGNFIVTSCTIDEVAETINFEALDYTKKFNEVFDHTSVTYPCTAMELAQIVCSQCGCELGSDNFLNDDYIIDGDVFHNNESCRDVMKEISKLAASWVRIDWDNKVYMDFTVNDTVDEYNNITNHEYYSLETQKEYYGPVNRVVIGYKDISGEQTRTDGDEESIEENGLCELGIYNNPFVYTQEQRESIIDSYEVLYGLKYMPLKTQTVGHPWLKGNELIKVTDMKNNDIYSIPFDRTIQYFGHIKTLINSDATSKTDSDYSYTTDVNSKFRNVQYQVDKINGTIEEEIRRDIGNNKEEITKVTKSITDIQNLFQITGGNNLIKNSVGLFGKNYWTQSEAGSFEYGEDADLIGKTTSRSKITISNGTLTSSQDNITGLTLSEVKTLSFKMKQDDHTTTTIKVYGLSSSTPLYAKTFAKEVNSWTDVYEEKQEESVDPETGETTIITTKVPIQFNADTPNLTLVIETSSDTGGKFYISDLMLNNGDKTEWQPSSGEIWGTVIKLSQLGISVYSVEGQFVTLMDSDGFGIYEYNGSTIGNKITSFNRNGVETVNIVASGSITQSKLVQTKINYKGMETYVEYIKE